MSNTPRTDEHLRMKEDNGHTVIVSREFARQLEIELADKNKQLADAKLNNENAEMYAVLKVCKSYFVAMGLQDSVIYKMICAALTEEGNEK